MKKATRIRLCSLVLFLTLMALWYFVTTEFGISNVIFPSPVEVGRSLYTEISSGTLAPHMIVTLEEVLVGFLIGALSGVVLGTLISQFEAFEKIVYPYIVAFQTLPKVALAPLFVVWFGFGISSKIFITATIVFFPVMVNMISGLGSAPKDQIDMAKAFMASKWQIFSMIRFPNALPMMFAGFDIGIVLAIIGALVGEFVSSQSGLGYLILQRNSTLDIPGVFSVLIVLSIMGMALHGISRFIGRKVTHWAVQARHNNPL